MNLTLSDISTSSPNRLMVIDALDWMGMPHDSWLDVCESGQVYVGLTEILPCGSWQFVNYSEGFSEAPRKTAAFD
jgi:hypothetical protein